MDVAVDLDRHLAVAVGWGSLSVYDVSELRQPVLKATLAGLGNTRKIILKDKLAFVAAREDGVWIIDLSDPIRPEILFQYDSIEWASGLAIDGPFLAIACRQHGVELVNVEDPRKPRHFSTLFRAHEAQSVCLANGFLYAGIWHESVVLIADIRNPQEPKILGRAELDGYGDGVAVKNNILYAATGHHSREYRGEHSLGSVQDKPGFGSGHGLEIFDVSDPKLPRRLGGIKAPTFYYGVPDLWSVKVSGENPTRAILADTYNGAFVVDISDPSKPFFLSRTVLPEKERIFGGGMGPDAVVGMALVEGGFLAAGYQSDLFFISDPELNEREVPENNFFGSFQNLSSLQVDLDERVRIYQPQGQVHDLVLLGEDLVAIAAGTDGIHTLEARDSLKVLGRYETRGAVKSLSRCGNKLYASEGLKGFSIWEIGKNGALTFLSRHSLNANIQQIVVPAPGKYALVKEGMHRLAILDLEALPDIRRALSTEGPGHFVGSSISHGLFKDRWACVFWQDGGPVWFDLSGAEPALFGEIRNNLYLGVNQGIAVQGDKALVLREGGILSTHPGDNRELLEVAPACIPGLALCGHPTLQGKILYVSARAEGMVYEVDVGDDEKPILIHSYKTGGNPMRVVRLGKNLLIANGYGGLRMEKTHE